MSISLRQLHLFEAIARLGRLTAAANEQAISQSAASQALKELESALGYSLFSRVGRELVITDAGINALANVREISALIEKFKTVNQNEMSGTLRVVASETIASFLLPKLFASFIAIYNEVTLDLKIANTHDVIDMVDKGQIHIGLIEGPVIHSRLTVQPWREDNLEVFCHSQHPLAQQGKLSLKEIQQQQWILREPGSGTRAIFEAAIGRLGAKVTLGLELTRHEAIKQSVKAGLGIGCLSKLVIADDIQAEQLTVLKTPLELSRRFSLVTHAASHLNPPASAFIQYLLRTKV
ncbi:LysR family transcriptional regulator [Zooshikella sp. RANM57]|uniref:LysR family transcriptional regulator n=1 Tax=Zooshikella sp. RANM57 TaxID=3425863 RepID=UPI003D6F936A